MNTSEITDTILQLTRAINCLDVAQQYPMEATQRMAIGKEITAIYAIIADIAESHTDKGSL